MNLTVIWVDYISLEDRLPFTIKLLRRLTLPWLLFVVLLIVVTSLDVPDWLTFVMGVAWLLFSILVVLRMKQKPVEKPE